MVSSVLEWRENLSFLSFTSKTIDIWNIFKKWHLQLLKSCYDIMYILIKKRCMDANSDVIHPPCSSRLLTLCCIGNFPNFWFHCYIIGYSWCALIVLEFIISGLLRLFCLSVFVKRGNFTFFFFFDSQKKIINIKSCLIHLTVLWFWFWQRNWQKFIVK